MFLGTDRADGFAVFHLAATLRGHGRAAVLAALRYRDAGVTFDQHADLATEHEQYCTEMVWRVYRQAGLDLPGWRFRSDAGDSRSPGGAPDCVAAQPTPRGRRRALSMSETFDPTVRKPITSAGEFDLVRRMGAGGFGVVFEARHRNSGLAYAVKRIDMSTEDAERYRNEALYPARIAAQSLHVMGVHSFFRDATDDVFYVVTELVPHGDLRAFLD